MIFVGIDIASEKHDCCFLNEKNKIIHTLSFSNSAQGFGLFLQTLNKLTTPNDRKIGLEATGIYGSNLQSFLRRNGVEFATINPLLLKNSIKGTTLRKTKTDKIDAFCIASFLNDERRTIQPDLPISYHISELKSLTRFRFDLVKKRSRAKIQAKGLLHDLFPEFSSLFSDVFGRAASAVLHKYPSAKAICRARTASLTQILKTASRGRLGTARASALKELAIQSIGTHSDAKEFALLSCLEEIAFHTNRIEAVERKIKEIMDEIDSPITTIPGIGTALGATILAEIGDIRRFSTPAKLLSFAGCEPSIYQSGKFVASGGKMVKRGSTYLRYAVLMAARLSARCSQTFSTYVQKKQAEGKHYNVATSHCAKKLLRIIFALLNKNFTFADNYSLPAA